MEKNIITNKEKKIVFVSFQGIINNKANGMVKFVLPVIEEINKNTSWELLYYVSNKRGYNGEINIRSIGSFYLITIRILAILSKLTFKISNYMLRYFQERLFDIVMCWKISRPVILISSAYLLKSIRKNKNLGGVNIFLAGNPDDCEINDLLKKEKEKHDVYFNDAYTYDKRIKYVSKSLFLFDHLVCFNMIQYDSYKKRIGSEKLSLCESHIIPDFNVFRKIDQKKNNQLTFCFIAHPFWLKGLTYLLDAWSTINISNIRLDIAGNINKDLQKVIDDKYSDLRNINYFGWVNNLNEFLRASDVCIIPSLLDAGPATVAEAMYCELPVIVSEGCGAKYLIKDGENGFVVPSADSEAIAKKIKWFFANKDVINKMGKKAFQTIENLKNSNQNITVAKHLLYEIAKYVEIKNK